MMRDPIFWVAAAAIGFVIAVAVVATRLTEADKVACEAKGGTPVYTRGAGIVCFAPGVVVK